MVLDPVEVLRRCGGIVGGTQLRELCGPQPIRAAVRDGRIVRAVRNRYVLPGGNEALAAAAAINGVVSHLSAAQLWGWPLRREPERPQISVRARSHVPAERRDSITVFWHDLPTEHRIHTAQHGLLTTRARTVVDCARTLPFADALSVADSALREGRVTRDELREVLASASRNGRSRALQVIEAADHRAANPFESSLRAVALEVPGLVVEPQFLVEWIGRVDLADPQLRLVLEADSYRWHGDPGVFRYDLRRHAALVRAGWTVVRFCWEDVIGRPAYVGGLLADLVVRGPDRRPVRVSAHDRRL